MVDVLERGDIYFLYRSKVDREPGEVEGTEDVQRMFVVLHPGGGRYRLLVIGSKHLPKVGEHGRAWGFVDVVSPDARAVEDALSRHTYETKTRGKRELPAARPAGEGVYAIVAHGDETEQQHTHLAYALELPRARGDVQEDLGIEDNASYIISVKNPDAPSSPHVGLRGDRKAKLPRSLSARFHGRRFADVDPPSFLDHEGAEVVLVGADTDVAADLGVHLDPQDESRAGADLCADLRGLCSEHRVEPLLRGTWV